MGYQLAKFGEFEIVKDLGSNKVKVQNDWLSCYCFGWRDHSGNIHVTYDTPEMVPVTCKEFLTWYFERRIK